MGVKKEPGSNYLEPGIYLATTYSHRTYRPTTIGAEAFHFRVRNGTGWFHLALVTRGRLSLMRAGLWGSEALNIGLIGPIVLIFILSRPLPDIHMEVFLI